VGNDRGGTARKSAAATTAGRRATAPAPNGSASAKARGAVAPAPMTGPPVRAGGLPYERSRTVGSGQTDRPTRSCPPT
jgi:hypothetical protein